MSSLFHKRAILALHSVDIYLLVTCSILLFISICVSISQNRASRCLIYLFSLKCMYFKTNIIGILDLSTLSITLVLMSMFWPRFMHPHSNTKSKVSILFLPGFFTIQKLATKCGVSTFHYSFGHISSGLQKLYT